MSFIFKLQNPFFSNCILFPIFINSFNWHININRTRIYLIRNFQIWQIPIFSLLFSKNCSKIHKSHRLFRNSVSMNVLPAFQVLINSLFYNIFVSFIFNFYIINNCFKSCVSAVITPVSVQHSNFSFRRISFFLIFKIFLNKQQVIHSHRQFQFIFKTFDFLFCFFSKSFINNNIIRIFSFNIFT